MRHLAIQTWRPCGQRPRGTPCGRPAAGFPITTPGNAEVGPPEGDPTSTMFVRRRPTLPQPLGCSTIGAERLNFRVRDGTGCFPFAMAAVTLAVTTSPVIARGWLFPSHYSNIGLWFVLDVDARLCRFLLRVCKTSPRPISTGRLGIAAVHLRPINPVFCWGPYPI